MRRQICQLQAAEQARESSELSLNFLSLLFWLNHMRTVLNTKRMMSPSVGSEAEGKGRNSLLCMRGNEGISTCAAATPLISQHSQKATHDKDAQQRDFPKAFCFPSSCSLSFFLSFACLSRRCPSDTMRTEPQSIRGWFPFSILWRHEKPQDSSKSAAPNHRSLIHPFCNALPFISPHSTRSLH